jgi:hypothetical protein
MLSSGGAGAQLQWTADDTFSLGNVEYVCRPLANRFPSTAQRFCLVKDPRHVERYAAFLRDRPAPHVVEIGMWDGASVALAAELARPDKLIGIELRPTPSEALAGFIADRDLDERVKPYYGVDQADVEQLAEILSSELEGEPLDLVVDDGSHLHAPTRITFNGLFPRLRPGGRYVVEDWPTHKGFASAVVGGQLPLTILVLELMLACSDRGDVVSDVSVNEYFTVVTRGGADIDARSFDVSECLEPASQAMLAAQVSHHRSGVSLSG